MFNHARTLLLNATGSNNPGMDYLGEELIPVEYSSLPLSTPIQNIRNQLFGAEPDRAMLNYRSYQLLSMIEKTDLQEFVTDLDPRITYEFGQEHTFALHSTWEPKLSQISGTLDDVLTISGTPARPDYVGKLYYQFEVSIFSPTASVFYLRVKRQTPPTKSETPPLTLTAGLSAPFDLYYTGYQAFLNTLNPDASWRIEGYLRPQVDLPEIVSSLESVGDDTLAAVFGVQHVEPWDTFRNLWYDGTDLVYRLGAITLPLIYRTDELRKNPNG